MPGGRFIPSCLVGWYMCIRGGVGIQFKAASHTAVHKDFFIELLHGSRLCRLRRQSLEPCSNSIWNFQFQHTCFGNMPSTRAANPGYMAHKSYRTQATGVGIAVQGRVYHTLAAVFAPLAGLISALAVLMTHHFFV